MDRIGILLRYGSVEPKTLSPILSSFISTLIAAFQKKIYKVIYFCYIYAKQYPIIWIFYNKSLFHTRISSEFRTLYTYTPRAINLYKNS